MKPSSDELKLAEELLADGNQDAWERGQLGKDKGHALKLSDHEAMGYMGDKRGTSIRLPDALIDDLRALAARKGLAYQAYLRMRLIQHALTKNLPETPLRFDGRESANHRTVTRRTSSLPFASRNAMT